MRKFYWGNRAEKMRRYYLMKLFVTIGGIAGAVLGFMGTHHWKGALLGMGIGMVLGAMVRKWIWEMFWM